MNWKVSRAFTTIGSGTTPKSDDASYYDDGTINWLITGDVNDGEIKNIDRKITTKALSDYSALHIYPVGSIVITMYGAIGKIGMLTEPSTVNQACCVLVPGKNVFPKYALHYFLATRHQLIELGVGGVQSNVSQDIIKSLRISLPSVEMQRNIASYLDRKVSIIDKIIAAKNHTHTHLLELRQAIITDAVLGRGGVGVNYRQTNIPWIGKIPAHWQVRKIKHVANIVLGKMLQSTEKEGYQYKKYLRAQNIRWEEVSIESVNKMWFSPRELSFCRLKEGDILVSEGGEVGRAAMWRNELSECYIQNSVNRLRVSESVINPKYLLYVIEGIGQAKVFENTVNRVSIAHLTREKLKEYSIPLPPLNEQRAIVKGIEESLRKIDKSVNGLQKSIDLLTEYRSSLISNVINGKVKV